MDEDKAAEEAHRAGLDDEGQVNFDHLKSCSDKNLLAQERLEIKRLRAHQIQQIMSLVRFSYLDNKDLMEASHNQVFAQAKDLIVEALAIRLNPQEAHDNHSDYKLNLEPRVLYQPERPDYITLPDGS